MIRSGTLVCVYVVLPATTKQTSTEIITSPKRRIGTPLISVGPTGQFSEVHRFAACSQLAGPPTPLISVGPTGQFSEVHRFAACSQLAGPHALIPKCSRIITE